MCCSKVLTKEARPPRVRPALTAQSLHHTWPAAPVHAPWSGAARPRSGFASTYPTTRPHRADGRVPGGRLGGDACTGLMKGVLERGVRELVR